MIKSPILHSVVALYIIGCVFVSCSEYQKTLKSTDVNVKYPAAIKYFEAKEYYKALPLLEELLAVYRGTPQGEKLYYDYAWCNFYLEDLTMAGFYFESFGRIYPYSLLVEETMYMSAKCNYLMSPEYDLDQESTVKAMGELQLFINRYPGSNYLAECNTMMDELEQKLEYKSFYSAFQYYRTGNYKAAVVSFDNFIKDYPASGLVEKAGFLTLKSQYLLALNSITEKKSERMQNAAKRSDDFSRMFPQSNYLKDANAIRENALKQ